VPVGTQSQVSPDSPHSKSSTHDRKDRRPLSSPYSKGSSKHSKLSASAYFAAISGAPLLALPSLMLNRCGREFQSALARIVLARRASGAVRPGLKPSPALIC